METVFCAGGGYVCLLAALSCDLLSGDKQRGYDHTDDGVLSDSSYIQDMSPMSDGFTYMTNHHPWILTLLFSVFFELGLALGDIRIGIAVYSVLHMCFLAAVFSGSLMYLCKKGVGKKRIIAIQILLMALPIFPLYSICMVKDTIYSAFCLIFILMMYEIASTKGEVLQSLWFDLAIFAVALLMILTKVFALQILVLVGVFYLLFYRRYVMRILAAVFLPVLLISVCVSGSNSSEKSCGARRKAGSFVGSVPTDSPVCLRIWGRSHGRGEEGNQCDSSL